MKKYISFAVSLVLFSVSACTSSTSATAGSTKSASPDTTSASNSSDKTKKDGEPSTNAKPETGALTDWQDYSSRTGKFSVKMPAKTEELAQETKTDVGKIKINMTVAEKNSSAYMVGYNDYPEKFADSEIQIRLTKAMEGFVTGSIQGEVKSSKKSMLGETPCLDFEGVGKIQSIDAFAKGRICIADNIRLYQVVAVGPSDQFSNSDVDRFVSSFKINK
ncbi:MAG: hypothetical protein DCF20_17375 [Pseudanabaena sp.]|nr:MAG: hypothetical protein DCF20_17375 [Pseudanabaena sp.]